MNELVVAAAQAVSIRGAVNVNLEHHCRLAERAADAGAGIVVFPELSLTGYELDIASELAFSSEDERLRPLAGLAEARGLSLVVGAPIRIGSSLYIGAFVLDPGQVPRVYTKRHVHADEAAVFVSGRLDPAVVLGVDLAALAICADTSHPEHAEAAARRGASLYLAGVFFDPGSYAAHSEQLSGYAARHSMAVVLANAGSAATGFDSAGGSAVWSDSGVLVACLEGVGAGLVVARRSERSWTGEIVRL
jgi:predicted amidohydrolase